MLNDLVDALAATSYHVPVGALIFGLTFGLAPGLLLRVVVLLYPKGNPRRTELLAELYTEKGKRAYLDRVVWVFEQLELALCEGLPQRAAIVRRARRRRRADRKEIAAREERINAETLGWAQAIIRERSILFGGQARLPNTPISRPLPDQRRGPDELGVSTSTHLLGTRLSPGCSAHRHSNTPSDRGPPSRFE